MKIYFCTYDMPMYLALQKEFEGIPDVECVCADFLQFTKKYPEVECIVSPANAYGYMDGSYDEAITMKFGTGLMAKVQQYILDNYYGEQPVGTSFIIDIPGTDKKLIHTPTMRVPSKIKDQHIIYQSMRTTLMCAIENNVQSIVIPAFGAGVGAVPCADVAKKMKFGYDQVTNRTTLIGKY